MDIVTIPKTYVPPRVWLWLEEKFHWQPNTSGAVRLIMGSELKQEFDARVHHELMSWGISPMEWLQFSGAERIARTRTQMTDQRWRALMASDDLNLTESEIQEGWHFCSEFDGLLVGPGMGERESCTCFKK